MFESKITFYAEIGFELISFTFLLRFDEKQNSSARKVSILNNNSRSSSKQSIDPKLHKTAQVSIMKLKKAPDFSYLA